MVSEIPVIVLGFNMPRTSTIIQRCLEMNCREARCSKILNAVWKQAYRGGASRIDKIQGCEQGLLCSHRTASAYAQVKSLRARLLRSVGVHMKVC